jgi:hypothetical protein
MHGSLDLVEAAFHSWEVPEADGLEDRVRIASVTDMKTKMGGSLHGGCCTGDMDGCILLNLASKLIFLKTG